MNANELLELFRRAYCLGLDDIEKMFAGDVLFYGSIGRTDLPGGDYNTLISRIKSELFVLPGDTSVFCGHGPETTIGYEKAHNPFLS